MVNDMNDNCIFCKIIKKEMPSNILYEDELVVVILDAFPDTDGHALVIPKKHYEDIYSVPDEVIKHMLEVGKNKGKEIMEKLEKTALTFLINYGDAQAVKHIHLHLLPNYLNKEHKLSKEEVYDKLMME